MKQGKSFTPEDILCSKNHLYRILIHLALIIIFITRKYFQVAGYRIFKKLQNLEEILSDSLTDHSRKVRDQTKQHTWPPFYDIRIDSLVGCAFWGSHHLVLQAVKPYQRIP